jgi:hypothetical protein
MQKQCYSVLSAITKSVEIQLAFNTISCIGIMAGK